MQAAAQCRRGWPAALTARSSGPAAQAPSVASQARKSACPHGSVLCAGMGIERPSRLSGALSALQAAARDYKSRRRRPAALIIDNAEQLGKAQGVMQDVLFAGQHAAICLLSLQTSSSADYATSPVSSCVRHLTCCFTSPLPFPGYCRTAPCILCRPHCCTALYATEGLFSAERVHALSAQQPLFVGLGD